MRALVVNSAPWVLIDIFGYAGKIKIKILYTKRNTGYKVLIYFLFIDMFFAPIKIFN